MYKYVPLPTIIGWVQVSLESMTILADLGIMYHDNAGSRNRPAARKHHLSTAHTLGTAITKAKLLSRDKFNSSGPADSSMSIKLRPHKAIFLTICSSTISSSYPSASPQPPRCLPQTPLSLAKSNPTLPATPSTSPSSHSTKKPWTP